MSSVVMLPSGRFRGFARHKTLKDQKVFDQEDKARTWATAVEKRMKAGTWEPPVKGAARALLRTFKEAAETYLASPQFLAKKDSTRHGEKHKLKPAIDALGRTVLKELSAVDIENHLASRALVQPKRAQWKAERLKAQDKQVPEEVAKSKLSEDQRRLELAAISAVFNYAKKQEWVSDNPTLNVDRPGSTKRVGRIDDEKMGALLDFFIGLEADETKPDKRPYWFFSLLFSCLARPGELAKARRDWLQADPPQIVLPSHASKNEDARVIVVPQSLYAGIVEYLKSEDPNCPYIFGTRSRDRKSWRPYNYAVPWSKARQALGYGDIVAHLARHEGITRLYERTELSDGQIGSLSGHRSAQSLWRYKHFRNELARDKIENLHEDAMAAANRHMSSLHPSRRLKPGERLGDNRKVVKTGR